MVAIRSDWRVGHSLGAFGLACEKSVLPPCATGKCNRLKGPCRFATGVLKATPWIGARRALFRDPYRKVLSREVFGQDQACCPASPLAIPTVATISQTMENVPGEPGKNRESIPEAVVSELPTHFSAEEA